MNSGAGLALHGVGLDIVDVARVERLLRRGDRFMRWFTLDEVARCKSEPIPSQSFAMLLAAKEAAWKSLRLDHWAGGVPWRSIETLGPGRAFGVRLHGELAEAALARGVGFVQVVVAGSGDVACAMAVAERRRLDFPQVLP